MKIDQFITCSFLFFSSVEFWALVSDLAARLCVSEKWRYNFLSKRTRNFTQIEHYHKCRNFFFFVSLRSYFCVPKLNYTLRADFTQSPLNSLRLAYASSSTLLNHIYSYFQSIPQPRFPSHHVFLKLVFQTN